MYLYEIKVRINEGLCIGYSEISMHRPVIIWLFNYNVYNFTGFYSPPVTARKSPAKNVSGNTIKLAAGHIVDSVCISSLIIAATSFVRDRLLTIVWALSSTESSKLTSVELEMFGNGVSATL